MSDVKRLLSFGSKAEWNEVLTQVVISVEQIATRRRRDWSRLRSYTNFGAAVGRNCVGFIAGTQRAQSLP